MWRRTRHRHWIDGDPGSDGQGDAPASHPRARRPAASRNERAVMGALAPSDLDLRLPGGGSVRPRGRRSTATPMTHAFVSRPVLEARASCDEPPFPPLSYKEEQSCHTLLTRVFPASAAVAS